MAGNLLNAHRTRALRIIVADDDHDSVLALTMVLTDEGHEVRGVHDGEQVLRALKDFAADALLLDIGMPGFSGWQIARKVREHYGARRGPLLIGISGQYKHGADRVLAELIGFDHYLTKPYEPSDLLRLLAPLR